MEFRLKILHVVTGLEIGGAEAVLDRLVGADSLNEHVIVSLYHEGPLGRRLKDRGTTVHALGLERGRFPRLGVAVTLWKIIRSHQPDLVQTWMYHSNLFASIVARFAGVPSVCWNIRRTDLPRTFSTRMISRVAGKLSTILPDKIIVCAEAAVRSHVAQGYSARRFIVIPNGIDASLFSPSTAARLSTRKVLKLGEDRPVIGYVGRLHCDKGHATLFEALRLLKADFHDLTCVLVGPGTEQANPELAGLARQHGVEDRIIGLGSIEDVPAIMNAVDLHVSPSVTEGFPNVIAEAMACGTPCVTTDVGDARLIVGDYGWVVPVEDPEALAASIAEGLNCIGTDRWRRLKQECRRRCESLFALPRMIESYQEIWQRTAMGRRRTSGEATWNSF